MTVVASDRNLQQVLFYHDNAASHSPLNLRRKWTNVSLPPWQHLHYFPFQVVLSNKSQQTEPENFTHPNIKKLEKRQKVHVLPHFQQLRLSSFTAYRMPTFTVQCSAVPHTTLGACCHCNAARVVPRLFTNMAAGSRVDPQKFCASTLYSVIKTHDEIANSLRAYTTSG